MSAYCPQRFNPIAVEKVRLDWFEGEIFNKISAEQF